MVTLLKKSFIIICVCVCAYAYAPQDMESEKVKYLRKRYRESPSSEKKIKFSDIYDDLASQFLTATWNARIVSETVRAAFPQSESKQHGRSHNRYIHGIEENKCESTGSSVQLLLEAERKKNEELISRVQHLERENADLRCAVLQPDVLDSQLQALMNSSHSAYHGPDTVPHFESFSVDSVITELRTHCPDVFRLLNTLGRVDRCEDPSNAQVTQLKSIISLLTLLKCRSVKVLGVQLLLSFMLIARATSKQVKLFYSKTTCTCIYNIFFTYIHAQAISVLNHSGVCVSYNTAWKYLKHLTQEAKYLEVVRDGHWLWVYDYLNALQSVRHEREGT